MKVNFSLKYLINKYTFYIIQNALIISADITAEELFSMFFGGFPQQEFYVRRGGSRWMRQNASQSQNTNTQVINFILYNELINFFSQSTYTIPASKWLYNISSNVACAFINSFNNDE